MSARPALLLLGALAACGGQAPPARDRPPDARGKRQIVEIDVDGNLDETSARLLPPDDSLRRRLSLLGDVRRDPDVVGVLAFIGSLETGPTKIEDLSAAFSAVRRSGRKVYCGVDSPTNLETLLAATSCDHIAISPGGSLELTGVAADVVFLRSALGSLGIAADVVREGAYKDAFEPVTRDDMSPEMRESLGALLDDTYAVLVGGVARGRNLPEATVRQLVDRGLFSPQEALAARLVDSVRHPDSLRWLARKDLSGKLTRTFGTGRRDADTGDVGELVRSLSGEPSPPSPQEPHLAIVYVTGLITSGGEDSGPDLLGEEAASARSLVRALDRARRDEATRAVVLRIDSPGGSASASELIWRAVDRVRRKKPIVASMSDTAASGGYYVAAGATKILARSSTVTGSIGVIGAKLVAAGLVERLGIHVEPLGRGAMSQLSSPFRPWSPEERSALERVTGATYDLFLRRVSEGRHRPDADVRRVAEGRVWTGGRAIDLGLVDQVGGFEDAMALARRLGKLPASCPVEVLPPPKSLLQRLVGSDPEARATLEHNLALLSREPLGGAVPAPLRRAAATLLLLERERSLAALPFSLQFR